MDLDRVRYIVKCAISLDALWNVTVMVRLQYRYESFGKGVGNTWFDETCRPCLFMLEAGKYMLPIIKTSRTLAITLQYYWWEVLSFNSLANMINNFASAAVNEK